MSQSTTANALSSGTIDLRARAHCGRLHPKGIPWTHCHALLRLNAVDRLRARDATLFASDAEGIALAENSLGWTDLARCCQPLPEYRKRTIEELGDRADRRRRARHGRELARDARHRRRARRELLPAPARPRHDRAAHRRRRARRPRPGDHALPRLEQVRRHHRTAVAVRDLPRRGRRAPRPRGRRRPLHRDHRPGHLARDARASPSGFHAVFHGVPTSAAGSRR